MRVSDACAKAGSAELDGEVATVWEREWEAGAPAQGATVAEPELARALL